MENQNKACKRTAATTHSYQSRAFRASQVLVSAIRNKKPAIEALWKCLEELDPMLYRMMTNGEWNEALDLANAEVEAIESEPLPSFQKLLAVEWILPNVSGRSWANANDH
jgi:hypothetical protein